MSPVLNTLPWTNLYQVTNLRILVRVFFWLTINENYILFAGTPKFLQDMNSQLFLFSNTSASGRIETSWYISYKYNTSQKGLFHYNSPSNKSCAWRSVAQWIVFAKNTKTGKRSSSVFKDANFKILQLLPG